MDEHLRNYEDDTSGGSNPELVEGKLVDIDFAGFKSSVSLLESYESGLIYLVKPEHEMLPRFINGITMRAYKSEHNPNLQLESHIIFSPKLVEQSDNWFTEVLNIAEDRLSERYTAGSLPHDVDALYLSDPDSSSVVRLQTTASLHSCAISVTNVDKLDFESTLVGEGWDGEDDSESQDIAANLQQMTYVLGGVLDSVLGQFDPQQPAKFLLEFAPVQPGNRLGSSAVRSTELVPLNEPQDIIPETKPDNLRFNHLGGAFYAKQRLAEIANTFIDSDKIDHAKQGSVGPRYFMLYGPTGTGKTSLVEAFANEAAADMEEITAVDLTSRFIGEPVQRLVAKIKDIEARNRKTVIFFDEADAIIGKQTNSVSHVEVKRELQLIMSRLRKSRSDIMFAAATNVDRSKLDDAFTRSGRFEVVDVTLPTREELMDIWFTAIFNDSSASGDSTLEVAADGEPIYTNLSSYLPLGEYDFSKLAKLTEDWTGADIQQVLERAKAQCDFSHQTNQNDPPPKVTNEILIEIIKHYHR